MRTTTRLVLVALVSVLALGVVPASTASAVPAKTSVIGCCR